MGQMIPRYIFASEILPGDTIVWKNARLTPEWNPNTELFGCEYVSLKTVNDIDEAEVDDNNHPYVRLTGILHSPDRIVSYHSDTVLHIRHRVLLIDRKEQP